MAEKQGTIVVWTRLSCCTADECPLNYAVRDASHAIVRTGLVSAHKDKDYTVSIELDNLPDGKYEYVFEHMGESGRMCSRTGATRTLTVPAMQSVNIASVSCSNYPHGEFNVYGKLADELVAGRVDAWVHLGDYIYEYDNSTKGYHPFESWQRTLRNGNSYDPNNYSPSESYKLVTLDEYRGRYKLYHSDCQLQALRAAGPYMYTPDDHEIANNYQFSSGSPDDTVRGMEWLRKKHAALRARNEYIPQPSSILSKDASTVGMRTFQFGDLLSVIQMNTRRGSPQVDIVDAVISKHDPTLFFTDGASDTPSENPDKVAPFLELRATMLEAFQREAAFETDEMEYIVNAIETATSKNVVLISGTQMKPWTWAYVFMTLWNSTDFPIQTVAGLDAGTASFLYNAPDVLAAQGSNQQVYAAIFQSLYGMPATPDNVGLAKADVSKIVSACEARGGCSILSGDVHNFYTAQHANSTWEYTTASVSSSGITQNIFDGEDIDASAGRMTELALVAQTLTLETTVSAFETTVRNSEAIVSAFSGAGSLLDALETTYLSQPFPKQKSVEVRSNGFIKLACGQDTCDATRHKLRIGCLFSKSPEKEDDKCVWSTGSAMDV